MLSDIKRDNHFLHQENYTLKEKLSLGFEDAKTRKRDSNFQVELKKHMRTESSKDYFQKTPSQHKLTEVLVGNKKSELIRTKGEMREMLSSGERKREIQKKIK